MPISLNTDLATEIRALLRLAWPLIMGNLGLIAIQLTDGLMIALLGELPFAAAGLAGHTASVAILFCSGCAQVIAPMTARIMADTTASQDRIAQQFWQFAWLLLFLCGLSCAPLFWASALFEATGQTVDVNNEATRFLNIYVFAVPFMAAAVLLRSALAGIGHTKIVAAATVITVITNFIGNYVLIFGKLGAPALGLEGAAYASLITTALEVLVLIYYMRAVARPKLLVFTWDAFRPRLRSIIRIASSSIPVGLTLLIEVVFFTGAALMIGRYGTDALAAHQLAIQVVTFTLMLSIGLSQALSIRVAHYLGAERYACATKTSQAGLLTITVIMAGFSVLIVAFADDIMHLYLAPMSPARDIAAQFLLIAALFQVADGAQTVAMGGLRGYDDTRMPLVISTVFYLIGGFGTSLLLSDILGLGAIGVWVAMAVTLAALACIMGPRLLTKPYAHTASPA